VHFWIQYAITARAFLDYRSADRYFSEAKAIARGTTTFNTYKLDNAYAQFLLESRMNTDHWSDFFDAFTMASTISLRQTYMERAGTYPYKVAGMFLGYLEVRGKQFSKEQKQAVTGACEAWLSRIEGLDLRTQRNGLVRRARASVSASYDLVS
jgi:hypothetical protein